MYNIPVNTPNITEEDREAVELALKDGYVGQGPAIPFFEMEFAEKVKRKYATACSSGSAALDIALKIAGVCKDEVIVPDFTIISPALSAYKAGAKVVPVDVDPATWCMDLDKTIAAVTEWTRAIICCHTYGMVVDIPELQKRLGKTNIWIIEDASQSLGQTIHSQPCGSFGDISIFSFYPNKTITTGEGGMVVTSEKHLDDEAKRARNLYHTDTRFLHDDIGWNYRMNNMSAALGISQLKRLQQHLAHKIAIGRRYDELLEETSLERPLTGNYCTLNTYWAYGVLHQKRDLIMDKLSDKGIYTRPFFQPIHRQEPLKVHGGDKGYWPVSDRLADHGFYLPTGTGMPKKHVEVVCDELTKVLKEIENEG